MQSGARSRLPGLICFAALCAESPQWSELRPELLNLITMQLPHSDLASVRLVCKAWASQLLQDVTQVHIKADLSQVGARLLAGLPRLTSVHLSNSWSLFHLHTLTQITALTLSGVTRMADFEPLSALGRLQQLRLDNCQLPPDVSLSGVSHITALEIWGGKMQQITHWDRQTAHTFLAAFAPQAAVLAACCLKYPTASWGIWRP